MGANKSYISVLGLYQYGPDLFDQMAIPAGLDRQNVIDNILLECAELECIYPSQEFLKFTIGLWSKKELPVWEKLLKTTKFEYNPIWNKDGVITETETHENSIRDTSHSENSGESHADTDTTSQVSAYDSANFVNRDKITGGNDIENSAESDSTASRNDTGNVTRERIEKGNIGITTTQQMIREEREVVKFNVTDYIVKSFRDRFCILIY